MIRARLALLLVLAFPFSLDGCEIISGFIEYLTHIAYGERQPLSDSEGEDSGCHRLSCRGNPQCRLVQENGSFERILGGSGPRAAAWFGDANFWSGFGRPGSPRIITCDGFRFLELHAAFERSDYGTGAQAVQLYDLRTYPELTGLSQIRLRVLANFYIVGDGPAPVGIHLEAYQGDPAPFLAYAVVEAPSVDPETFPEDDLLQRLKTDVLLEPNLEKWQPVQTEWIPPEGATFLMIKLEMRTPADPETEVYVDDVRVALDGGPYAPLVADDWATTYEDLPVATEVTFNDTDYDGFINLSSLTIIDQPRNGAITAIEPGLNDIRVTYTPNPDFVGLDAYSYTVADDEGNVSSKAIVTVSVREGLPDYDLRVVKRAAATRRFLDQTPDDLVSAGDTLTYTVFITNAGPGPARNIIVEDRLPPALTTDSPTVFHTPPVASQGAYTFDQGTRVVTWTLGDLAHGAQGRLTMTLRPDAAASGGPYHNTAQITQGLGGDTDPGNDTATVSVRVNIRPLARADTATTTTNTALSIAVLANDEDPGGMLNSGAIFFPGGQLSDSGFGIVSVPIPADGTVTYTPTGGFTGTDTFRYVVRDDQGAVSNEAVVMVMVQ